MLIPCLRYRNAPAAIAWLCAAFGFERRLVVPGPGDTVMHSPLTLGDGMIIVGSARADEYADPFRQPNEIGEGRGFACVDPEGHHWYAGSYDLWATPEGEECA